MKINLAEDNVLDYILMKLKNNEADLVLNEIEELINDNINIENILLTDTIDYIKSFIKPKEINTIEDLAKLLNDNYRNDELKNPYNIDIEKLCKDKKWIILFPYSDDNLEVRGYIDDEVGAYNGGNYTLIKKGDFYKDDEWENTYHRALEDSIVPIDVIDATIFVKWCDDNSHPYTWYIDTAYNDVAYFDIKSEDDEEHEIWARCCIIDYSKLRK